LAYIIENKSGISLFALFLEESQVDDRQDTYGIENKYTNKPWHLSLAS
jgi:hypothetical protein